MYIGKVRETIQKLMVEEQRIAGVRNFEGAPRAYAIAAASDAVGANVFCFGCHRFRVSYRRITSHHKRAR